MAYSTVLRKQLMAPDLNLLQQLNPETRVLIWTHSGPLDLQTPGIACVDYLLDGLVAGHVNAHAEEPLHHVVFSHPQFGNSFWVGFVNTKQVSPNVFMSALKAALPSNAAARATLYSAESLSTEWDKALRGTFKQIDALTIS
mgnify:CR=1 FL=1